MKEIKFIVIYLFIAFSSNGQAPSIQWQKCFGGSEEDEAFSVLESPNGGYYILGYTASHDGDVSNNTGNYFHFWLLRVSDSGTLLWEKNYGGSWGREIAYNMQFTTDGGLIMIGEASSDDGDVIGWHPGDADVWVVKTDSMGNLQWQKCLGGSNRDYGNEIKQTMDGGFILAASTRSWEGDVTNYLGGSSDVWIVKLDNLGNLVWQKSFGGWGPDYAYSIVESETNNFWFGATTNSIDHDISFNHGGSDIWIVKIDTAQNIISEHCFGGSGGENCVQLLDNHAGGVVVFGSSESINGDVTSSIGGTDFWRFSTSGISIIDRNNYGASSDDLCNSASRTSDQGYFMSGDSYSNGPPTFCNTAFYGKFLVVRTDSTGNLMWTKCMGGTGNAIDEAFDGIETSDGGYIVVGVTESNDGDVSGNHGGKDIWVVKLAPAGVNVPELSAAITDFSAFENSNGALHLNFSAEASASLKLSLLDFTGREVYTENYSCIGGMNSHSTSALSLSPGIYVLQLSDGEGMMVKKVFVNGRN